MEGRLPLLCACSQTWEVYTGEVHGKKHATLISTYLVTQIESYCLIIRGRRVFSLSPQFVEFFLNDLHFRMERVYNNSCDSNVAAPAINQKSGYVRQIKKVVTPTKVSFSRNFMGTII